VREAITMRILMLLLVPLGALITTARADQYWIAYEGNDFPEDVGWTRLYGDENGPQQGGADRRLEDGVLHLDSLRNALIYDYYRVDRPIDPDPGDLFVAEWRLKITESVISEDTGLVFARDDLGTLCLMYTADEMISRRENWHYPIAPYVFHTYRIESSDMIHYSLWIDSNYARDGEWDLVSLNQSFVLFGDIHYGGGATSYAEWDYFRFGTVPEPASGLLIAVGFLAARGRL
jgi:hypothetical protein